MFVYEDGPYDIFARLRGKIHEISQRRDISCTWKTVYSLFRCPYCLGVWSSFGFVALSNLGFVLTDFVVLGFAVSGVQFLVQLFVESHTEEF
jgi:hypothetical protein